MLHYLQRQNCSMQCAELISAIIIGTLVNAAMCYNTIRTSITNSTFIIAKLIFASNSVSHFIALKPRILHLKLHLIVYKERIYQSPQIKWYFLGIYTWVSRYWTIVQQKCSYFANFVDMQNCLVHFLLPSLYILYTVRPHVIKIYDLCNVDIIMTS